MIATPSNRPHGSSELLGDSPSQRNVAAAPRQGDFMKLIELPRLGLAALACSSCLDRQPFLDEPLVTDGPYVTDRSLVLVNRLAGLVASVTPETKSVTSHLLPNRARATAIAGTELLAISDDGLEPELFAIDAVSGAASRIPLRAAFDRIWVAPGARHAVLSYLGDGRPAPGAPAARNPNELEVVELGADVAQSVVIESESLAPRSVVFDAQATMAAVLLGTGVSIIDLARPNRRLDVPFELAGGGQLTPVEAEFMPDGKALVVRAAGTSDVIVISIESSGEGISGSINFLFAPSGGTLNDFVIPKSPALAGKIAAVYDGEASVAAILSIDGDASSTQTVRLTRRFGRICELDGSTLLIHDARAAGEAGLGQPIVAAWDPTADRVRQDELSSSGVSGEVRLGNGVAYFEHRGEGISAITAVRAERRGARLELDLRPIGIGGGLSAVADFGGEVYAGVTVPRQGSGAAPDSDDDESFTGSTGSLVVIGEADVIEGLPFDDEIVEVGRVGGYIYARHTDPFGDFSFVARTSLERDLAFRVDGLVLGSLFDRGREELP